MRCTSIVREAGLQHERRILGTAHQLSAPEFINHPGDEAMGSTWSYLDFTALGRQEEWEDSPEGYPQTPPYKWWNWHDEYGNTPSSRWSSVVDRSLDLQGQPVDRNADDLDSAAARLRHTDSNDGDGK
jgi:hypothetical protein